ncbi:MAG: ABC transporter ATP-binding protein, partial [Pseudomonadota bacterium]
MAIDDASPAFIDIKNLSKSFGAVTAVDDLTLTVRKGEIVGFLGPNGAGKSTTMKMIAGFLKPDAGSIAICGEDIASAPAAAQGKLGYLPEGAPSYGEMTPRRFLGFIADARGFRKTQKAKAIDNAATRAQLGQVMDRRIETLSKGFRRRVGLAQAILHDAPVLVLDEPTDGLDPNQKFAVRRLIRSMAADKAILVSTHILEEVDALCDRVVVIDGGRLAAEGTPAELLAKSRYKNAVSVDAPPEAAEAIRNSLKAFADRADVRETKQEGVVVFDIFPRNGASMVLDIAAALDGGPRPKGIYAERGRLDDIFR